MSEPLGAGHEEFLAALQAEDVSFERSEIVDEPLGEFISWLLVAHHARHEPGREAHYYELRRIKARRRAIRKEFLRRELLRRPRVTHNGSLSLTKALSALQGVRQKGPHKWVALCPAHDDNLQSLAVWEHSDKPDVPVFFCSAGCTWQDIRSALSARS